MEVLQLDSIAAFLEFCVNGVLEGFASFPFTKFPYSIEVPIQLAMHHGRFVEATVVEVKKHHRSFIDRASLAPRTKDNKIVWPDCRQVVEQCIHWVAGSMSEME